MIPQSVLDQIQDRSDIVEVIQQVVPLRKMGRNFKAPCPFHSEKTPSFVVSPDKQIFHCFGCGVGGNVFGFLTKLEKIEFPEAVRRLAERAGIVIPEDESLSKKKDSHQPLHDGNALAAEFYAGNLNKAARTEEVWQYIFKRGITPEALSKFNIGFSTAKWDAFLLHAKKRFNESTLIKAGLLLEKRGGGHYDRFRNRLMFPIRNARGKVVGFGARVLDQSLPKYINSPETPIYYKGRVLYGLHEAASAIRNEDRVILVEGYMDVVACFQAGIENSVSASGTALTLEQIRLTKRYTKNVTVLFDADQAGQLATLRGLDLLVEEGCYISVARMPEGHDPDSYVKEFGEEKFRLSVLEKAQALFEYKFGLLSGQHDLRKVEGKLKIATEMLSTIRRVPNEIFKVSLVKELSENLNVSEEALLLEMKRSGSGLRGMNREEERGKTHPKKPRGDVPMVEKLLLGLSISFQDVWERAKERVTVVDFENEEARKVADMVLQADAWKDIRPAKIMNRVSLEEDASLLIRQAVHEVENISDADKAFDDCLDRLEKTKHQIKLKKLQADIVACEQANDLEKLTKLLEEFNKYSKRGR